MQVEGYAVMIGITLLLASLAVGHSPVPLSPTASGYGLDGVSRKAISRRGKLKCPKVRMVKYRGTHLRYQRATWVFTGFATRLARFEQVVSKVAKDVYGRAPSRINHMGTFNCRRIGGYPNLISEHGLGNGIDVAGFRFSKAPQADRAKAPASLRGAFNVSVLKHWDAKRGVGRVHARFLHQLARALVKRQDIFRVLLGPGYPGHKNHFHFDVAPYRLVQIW
jgi:hypothetical protein